MLSVSSPLASERSHEVQVANDAASAKELPSCEARPGRRVNNSAAGKLQGGELREDCVEGALERGESAAFVAYEASSVASALEAWSAVMLASRLACAATKLGGDPAGHLLFWCLPPVACPVRPPWRAGRPARLRPPCRGGRRPGPPW